MYSQIPDRVSHDAWVCDLACITILKSSRMCCFVLPSQTFTGKPGRSKEALQQETRQEEELKEKLDLISRDKQEVKPEEKIAVVPQEEAEQKEIVADPSPASEVSEAKVETETSAENNC